MRSWAIFWRAAQGSENILPMHVICDCAVALTETFEDVEVEASQKVTVHHGYVRPNRLGIHTAFSCWKHFCPPTLLLGQAQGMLTFPWPNSAASVSSYSFLFWAAPAPTLFSSSALSHLSSIHFYISLPLWFQSLFLSPSPSIPHLLAWFQLRRCWPMICMFPYPLLF